MPGLESGWQKFKLTKIGIAVQHRETDCDISQNGYRSSHKIEKTKKCQHQATHPQTRLKIQIRNVQQMWYRGSTVFILTSPIDRNCEIWKRTKMSRVPCRKRTGEVVLRALKLTADHKVLNEGGESRNNHRHAVVIQELATQWIQSYPCETKTSQETERSLRSFSSRRKSQQSFTLTIPWNLANPVKILPWNHWKSTLHRSETNGVAERAVRKVKEGTFAVFVAIRLGWKMVGWFHGVLLLLAKCPTPPGRWENTSWTAIWRTI